MITTHLTYDDLMVWEHRKRANFVNSIGGFKSVCLIGTKNKARQTNLAIFNSIVHIGANPPLIGFFIRPDSVERHTLENIIETGTYTINHINENIFVQAHQTSARYPRDVSEFTKANLTEEYLNDFFAPFVKESTQKIGVEFKEKIDVPLNGTSLLIGEIKSTYIPKESLKDDGFIDLEESGTITSSGLDSYHTTHKLARLSYAKPDQWPSHI
jgi:flavin reductase (DIM6/NTAB) family NADH-FMN oxidoreductase RutF